MAVKRALSATLFRLLHMRSDFTHYRRAECDVRHEMSVHNIDVQPVSAMAYRVATCLAQRRKIGRQDRGSDYCRGRHLQHEQLSSFFSAIVPLAASRAQNVFRCVRLQRLYPTHPPTHQKITVQTAVTSRVKPESEVREVISAPTDMLSIVFYVLVILQRANVISSVLLNSHWSP